MDIPVKKYEPKVTHPPKKKATFVIGESKPKGPQTKNDYQKVLLFF